MLGNQLNPSSSMAQKMHDSLNQEVEAHSIYTSDSSPNPNLIGPQLHSRVIASVRIIYLFIYFFKVDVYLVLLIYFFLILGPSVKRRTLFKFVPFGRE